MLASKHSAQVFVTESTQVFGILAPLSSSHSRFHAKLLLIMGFPHHLLIPI